MKTVFAWPGDKEQLKEPGCFVAGTLVHTREGLRPIESVAVGDFVLSKPESGAGEASYRKVTQTFRHDDREVYFLYYTVIEPDVPVNRRKGEVLVVTGAHPFWVRTLVDNYGEDSRQVGAWMNAHDLFEAGCQRMADVLLPLLAELELSDGRGALLEVNDPLLRTAHDDRGIAFGDGEYWQEQISGVVVEFTPDGPIVRRNPPWGLLTQDMDVEEDDIEGHPHEGVFFRSGGFHPMRRQVFNIEVDGNHTYYVGEAGVLVHNTSGFSAVCEVGDPGCASFELPPSDRMTVRVPCRMRPNLPVDTEVLSARVRPPTVRRSLLR